MSLSVLPLRGTSQRLKFVSDQLGCVRSVEAARAAYYAESFRGLVAGAKDGCDHAALLHSLLYARKTCDRLFQVPPDAADDLTMRARLINRLVGMGEAVLIDEKFMPAPTREIRFEESLSLIAGTIPLPALRDLTRESILHSGSARYTVDSKVFALSIEPAQWLGLQDVNERWLDAFVRHYSNAFSVADAGMQENLEMDVFCADGHFGKRWIPLNGYSETHACLVRYKVARGFVYLFARLNSSKDRRIDRYAQVPIDDAIRFECAALSEAGRPKRLAVHLDGDVVRFRNVGFPERHRLALSFISHEELTNEKKWNVSCSAMMPVIRYIAQSAKMEIVQK
jgi:hypothetical protein